MGVWEIDTWADRVTVFSDSMPPDTGFELVGYESKEEALRDAKALCDKLNGLAHNPTVC